MISKRDIIKLAEVSYTNNELDEKTVFSIAEKLTRKALKVYIRALQLLEKKHEVIVALPDITKYNKTDNFFEAMLPDKKIIYTEDRSLLLGAKIIDNDMVYDISLQSRLSQEKEQMEENF